MTAEPAYTLTELAERAGVTRRTIRYYIANALLPSPDVRGKYARYSTVHLERLLLIARFKAEGLTLVAIRAHVAAQTTLPYKQSSSQPGASASALVTTPGTTPFATVSMPTSRHLISSTPEHVFADTTTSRALPLGQVALFSYEAASPPLNVDTVREDDAHTSTMWRHVVLAPDVELHIREPISPQRREQLDALATCISAKLRT